MIKRMGSGLLGLEMKVWVILFKRQKVRGKYLSNKVHFFTEVGTGNERAVDSCEGNDDLGYPLQ